MKILLLSRYGRLAASSRLRCYQYLPFLQSAGIEVTSRPLLDDGYVAGLYSGRAPRINVALQCLARLRSIVGARRYDLLWFEKELLPWLPSWVELSLSPSGIPTVVDYDDAVFHRYEGHDNSLVRWALGGKIDQVMANASVVVAGNEYLAGRARHAGARSVEILPTVVDLARYTACASSGKPSGGPVVVGWVGNPGTARYLQVIAPVIRELAKNGCVRFVAIGANESQLEELPIEAIKWSEDTEVDQLRAIDIGIMPLPDEAFERGKCGYKLIQYMACCKPVVASPVGVNAAIVEPGVNGFLASSAEEWKAALVTLIGDERLRNSMGAAGRMKVEKQFNLQEAALQLTQILRSSRR